MSIDLWTVLFKILEDFVKVKAKLQIPIVSGESFPYIIFGKVRLLAFNFYFRWLIWL